MKTIQKEYLLQLYTKYSLDEIDNNFAGEIVVQMGKNQFSELKNDTEFNVFTLNLKECKSEIEKILKIDIISTQVCCLLDLLAARRNSPEDEYSIYVEFSKKTIYQQWEQKYKDHFDFALKQIIEKRQVFISYTTRGCPLNNALYTNLIANFLDANLINQYRGTRKNLIVWAIKQHLIEVNQLTGYFDQNKDDFAYGDNVLEQLKSFCDDSLLFLQILEKHSFAQEKKESPNYCFNEFKFFNDGPVGKQHPFFGTSRLFIVRSPILPDKPDSIYPINFPPDFNNWKNIVHPITYLKIYPEMPLNEFLLHLELITADIKERADQILTNYKALIKAEA